jgi:hypothetical protein
MRLVKQENDFWPFLCGIDLALAKPFIANDSCTWEFIKFAQQVFSAVAEEISSKNWFLFD